MKSSIKEIINKYKVDSSGDKVVYTAVFGDLDSIHDPVVIDENTEYYFFTNNPSISSTVWNVVYCDDIYIDSIRTAKIFKIFPQIFFSKFKYSLWVDGCYSITNSLSRLFAEGKTTPISFFPHPYFDCLYKESFFLKLHKKDCSKVLDKQINFYKSLNVPRRLGLIHGSVIVRDHAYPMLDILMNDWWFQIDNYSKRDQLSFNFVAWKHSVSVNYFDKKLGDSAEFQWIPRDADNINFLRRVISKLVIIFNLYWLCKFNTKG